MRWRIGLKRDEAARFACSEDPDLRDWRVGSDVELGRSRFRRDLDPDGRLEGVEAWPVCWIYLLHRACR